MIFSKHIGRYLFVFVGLFSIFACRSPVEIPKSPFTRNQPSHLLVMPFKDMMRIYGENTTVRCPLCGKVFTTRKVTEGADDFLTKQVISILKQRDGIRLIPPSQAQGVLAQLLSKSGKETPELELISETGRILGADAVLVGSVYRFRDRSGTEYSVDMPASVAFDIDLVSTADQKIIWNGHFNETQQALTDNLFKFSKFIKRKGRWIGASDMAVSGLEDVFQTFPMP